MPGPSVRSPVEEFRRRRRESRNPGVPEPGRLSEPDRMGAADPNEAARERWRRETADALRQVPAVPQLDPE